MLVSHGVRGFYYIPCIGSGQPRGHLDRLSVTAAWWHLSCHGYHSRQGEPEGRWFLPRRWQHFDHQISVVNCKLVFVNWKLFHHSCERCKMNEFTLSRINKNTYLTTDHFSKICWSIRFKLGGQSRPFSGQRMAKHLFVFNLKEIWKCAEAGPIRQPGLSLTGHSGVETTAIKNCPKILQRVEVLDKCIG